jgi:serine/threonine protein kinase
VFDPLAPGSLVRDRYRVQRSISVGGWGEVYRGIDQKSGHSVAIKRCLKRPRGGSSDLSDQYVARRALEEISVLKELDCPGVPRFVDSFSLDGGIDCLVMEYIEGIDLNQQVRDSTKLAGRLPSAAAAVGYVVQVCRILEYLHSLNPPMIHRDIKPSNLILRHSDSRVYLVDFGFARHIGPSAGTKSMVGTLGYAAIEQCQGHPTVLSDQYALGATLFFLLTGSQPTPFAIESLQSFRSDLPQELVDSVAKATRPAAGDRYASVAQWREHLETVWLELLKCETEAGTDSTLAGLPIAGLSQAPDSFEFQPDTDAIAEPDSEVYEPESLRPIEEDEPVSEAFPTSTIEVPVTKVADPKSASLNQWIGFAALVAISVLLVGGFYLFGPRTAGQGTYLSQPSVDTLAKAWPAPLNPKLLGVQGAAYSNGRGKITLGAVAQGAKKSGFALSLKCAQPAVLKLRWEGGGNDPVFYLRCRSQGAKRNGQPLPEVGGSGR